MVTKKNKLSLRSGVSDLMDQHRVRHNGQWDSEESIITLCHRLDISIFVTLDNADN